MPPSVFTKRIRSAIAFKLASLRQHYQTGSEYCFHWKEMVKERWRILHDTEKKYVIAFLSLSTLVVIQFIWIIALQYQVSTLSELTQEHEYRIDKLGESSDKHNDLLYDLNSTVWDIKKKWNDLNFRVLKNTWDIDKPIKKEANP